MYHITTKLSEGVGTISLMPERIQAQTRNRQPRFPSLQSLEAAASFIMQPQPTGVCLP